MNKEIQDNFIRIETICEEEVCLFNKPIITGNLNEIKRYIKKQQAEIEKKDKIIKLAYREANNVLYFDDNSDYCCALWEILRIINPELEEYPTLNYIDKEDK